MAEKSCKTTEDRDSLRSAPTPFLTKTYHLVDDDSSNHLISWNEDGSTFIVWNTFVFARDLLPLHFKHNNFPSFLRQLNTYGFRKVVSEHYEYANDWFRRGEKQLLCEIQRRRLSIPAASTAKELPENSDEEKANSSDGSPTRALAELIDENERLRKEKINLTEQLLEVKSLCNNISSLMLNFKEDQLKQSFELRESDLKRTKSLDLFPMKRFFDADEAEDAAAETIGVKRAREYGEGCSASQEDETILRLRVSDRLENEIKSEPLDFIHQITWLNQVHRENQRICN